MRDRALGPTSSVTVTRAASAWVATSTDTFVLFRSDGLRSGSAATEVAVRAVLDHVRSSLPGEAGPFAFDVVTQVDDEVWFRVLTGGTSRQRRAWLDAVANRLSDLGHVGEIARPRKTFPPDEILAASRGPRPTLCLRFDDPPQTGHGHRLTAQIEVDDLQRVLRRFGSMPPTVYISSNSVAFWRPADETLAPLLRDLTPAGGPILMSGTDPQDLLVLALSGGPAATVTRIAKTPWSDRVSEGRDALMELADRLTLGYIRTSDPGGYAAQSDPPPEYPSGYLWAWYFGARHLWGEYLVDAHGIQLVTDRVLARAHDLSSWRVTPAAPGRYLVEAQDLAAWYSEPVPQPAALTSARRDFGDMIVPVPLLQQTADAQINGAGNESNRG